MKKYHKSLDQLVYYFKTIMLQYVNDYLQQQNKKCKVIVPGISLLSLGFESCAMVQCG